MSLQIQNQHPDCNRPLADASLVACPDCDLLQRIPEVPAGASVRCPRCDKELWRHKPDSLNRTFALTIAALVLYIIANTVPMLGLHAAGREAFTTVVGGAHQLWLDGQQIVAVLVLFAAVISPALQIGFLLLILLGCRRERPPFWVGTVAASSPFHPHLEHDRSHAARRAGGADEDCGLRHGHSGRGAVRAVRPGDFARRDADRCFDPREVWERVEWAEADAQPSS